MKNLIVVGTSPGREKFAEASLRSLGQPALVISDFGYESGKLKWISENVDCDRVMFVQDTIIATNPELLNQAFSKPGSVCLNCDPNHFGSFLGIFETKILRKIPLVDAISKEESIRFERDWNLLYLEHCTIISHFGQKMSVRKKRTPDSSARKVLILENDIFRKVKTNWGQSDSRFILEHTHLESMTDNPSAQKLELLRLRHDTEALLSQASEREELVRAVTRRELSASVTSHIKMHLLDFIRFLKLKIRGLI